MLARLRIADWPANYNVIKLNNLLDNAGLSEKTRDGFVAPDACEQAQALIDNALKDPRPIKMRINLLRGDGKPWKFHGSATTESAKSIHLSTAHPAHFLEGFFSELRVQNLSPSVEIENASIRDFHVEVSKDAGAKTDLLFTNSWLSRLTLAPSTIRHFSYRDGGIGDIDCPGSVANNPFTGSVVFSKVFLPRTRRGFQIEGAQPYRNMRYHLAQLQNGPAASIFHSAELAVERDDERGLNWFFNFLYEEFSDYGASPVRPLIWLGLLWIATATLLFATGVEIGGSPKDAVGWQSLLYRTDWKGDLLRAVIVGFQPISWLGSLISPGQPVAMVPSCLLTQIWLVIDGILSTVLLALFIFALRRRFRMAS